MEPSKCVIIVAGGKGNRMNNDLPKQFIEIDGLPIIIRTIKAFLNYLNNIRIVVAINKDYKDYLIELISKHLSGIEITITDGGEERFHSVKNALKVVPENSLIAIHDSVRPFVSKEVIAAAFYSALLHGNAVPVVDIAESIRMVEGNDSFPINRNKYKVVQTPQVFKSEQIKAAYDCSFSADFTDDASVAEKSGIKIHLIEGNIENIKITTPFDLLISESIIKSIIKMK